MDRHGGISIEVEVENKEGVNPLILYNVTYERTETGVKLK